MNTNRWSAAWLSLAAFGLAGAAAATQVSGSAAVSNGSVTPAPSAPVSSVAAFQASSRIYGEIQSILPAAGQVVIAGQTLAFSPARVMVVSASQGPQSPQSLRVGQKVHFMLDPHDPLGRTVRVFFLP